MFSGCSFWGAKVQKNDGIRKCGACILMFFAYSSPVNGSMYVKIPCQKVIVGCPFAVVHECHNLRDRL